VTDRALALNKPGTYALVLACQKTGRVRIGRLGVLALPPGFYVYVGSAFGPGGLRARLGRHLNHAGAPRWHIDTLLPAAQLIGFWATTFPSRLECGWVATLAALPGASYPASGLGSSDCRHGCPAHLLAFTGFDQQAISEQLEQTLHAVAQREQIHEYRVTRTICPPNERFT